MSHGLWSTMAEYALHIRPRVSPALGRALDRLMPQAEAVLSRRSAAGPHGGTEQPGLPEGALPVPGDLVVTTPRHLSQGERSEETRDAMDSGPIAPMFLRKPTGAAPGELRTTQTRQTSGSDGAAPVRRTPSPAVRLSPPASPVQSVGEVNPNVAGSKDRVHWLERPDDDGAGVVPQMPEVRAFQDTGPRSAAAGRQALSTMLQQGTVRRTRMLAQVGGAAAPLAALPLRSQPLAAPGSPGLRSLDPMTAGLFAAVPERMRDASGNWAEQRQTVESETIRPRDPVGAETGAEVSPRMDPWESDFAFDQRLRDALGRLLSQDLLRHGLSRPGDS